MKYNIIINQKALVAIAPELDIIHYALIDYLFFLCSTQNEAVDRCRIRDDSGVWTWIDLAHLLSEMPALHIKSVSSASVRINAIADAGFIETRKGKGFRMYIRLLPLVDSAFVETKASVRVHESQLSSRRKDNTTTDHPMKKQSKSHSRGKRGGLKIIKLKEEGSPEGKTVNEVIAAFEVVNPAVGTLFSRQKQRSAAEQLLEIYPLEQLLAIVECLKITNELEYTPKAYDPVELLAKSAKILGKIREEIKKHRSDGFMHFDTDSGQQEWRPGSVDKAGDTMRRALEKPRESAAPASAVIHTTP